MEDVTSTGADLALNELVVRHGLNDHLWLKTLDEFDEPPVFIRADEVQFLSMLPWDERGPLVLRCMVGVLDGVAEFLTELEDGARFYACVAFMNWELVSDGTQSIPRSALFVSPNWQRELADFRLEPPTSPEGREVERWLSKVARHDLVVAETPVLTNELHRVWVGYRGHRAFKSVGDFVERGPVPRTGSII